MRSLRVFVFLAVLATLGTATTLVGCDHQTTPTCTLTATPTSQSVPSTGGTFTVVVTASANSCTWTATADVPWVSILQGAAGSGGGTVMYSVGSNPSTDSRTGAISIGGQTHRVDQQGRTSTTCSYTIAPTSASLSREPQTGQVAVAAPAGCSWTVVSTATWLTVTSGGQGSGSGTVTYTVTRNDNPAARDGTLLIGDQMFQVTQAGEPQACQYSVAPVQFEPCMPAGAGTVTVTTSAGCTWTAAPDVSWLSIGSGSSGSGSGTITFSFSSNYDPPRTGQVLVRWPTPTAGQNVHVSQAGCYYGVSTTTIGPLSAAGDSAHFDVVQQSDPIVCGGPLQDGCIWSASTNVSWITLSRTGPHAGDDRVNFTVAPNNTGSQRAGTITVRDQVVQVTQSGS